MLEAIPAIDLKAGQVVRLSQGIAESARTVHPDPFAAIRRFESAGATSLHVVNLDGAFTGSSENEALIHRILKETSLRVQVGGGLRTSEAIARVFDAGAHFAVVGTLLARDPDAFRDACEQHPGKVIAAVDGKNDKVVIAGWTEATELGVTELAQKAETLGAAAVLFTDVSRDGMGTGVNVDASRALQQSLSIPVIASGGVKDQTDLLALQRAGVAKVVLGKAIYDGSIDLAAAIMALKEATNGL